MPQILPFITTIIGGLTDKDDGFLSGSSGGLLDFFVTGDEGKDKIQATRVQQQIEEAAKDVERQMAAGTMDAETAIRRLQQLEAQIEKMMASGSPAFQRGAALASRTVSNIMAGARRFQSEQRDVVFNPDVGFEGNEERQKGQLGSNVRDALGGANSGFEDDSPLGSLFTGPFDVEGSAKTAKGLSGSIFGDRGTPGVSSRLTQLTGEGEGRGAIEELGRRRTERSFKDLDDFNFNEGPEGFNKFRGLFR